MQNFNRKISDSTLNSLKKAQLQPKKEYHFVPDKLQNTRESVKKNAQKN